MKDEYGKDTFDNKKGTFQWEKNLMPTFLWYNGASSQYMLGDAMNPDEVTHLNKPQGTRLDPQSKIHPFKVMRGKQAYDKKNQVLVVTKLYGKTGLWKTASTGTRPSPRAWRRRAWSTAASTASPRPSPGGRSTTWSRPRKSALKCVACHDMPTGRRLDWKALGYTGDPSKKRGVSRFELTDAYRDVNVD